MKFQQRMKELDLKKCALEELIDPEGSSFLSTLPHLPLSSSTHLSVSGNMGIVDGGSVVEREDGGMVSRSASDSTQLPVSDGSNEGNFLSSLSLSLLARDVCYFTYTGAARSIPKADSVESFDRQ